MSFLLFILFIFLFIVIFGFSVISSIVRALFGLGGKRSSNYSGTGSREQKEEISKPDKKKKKVFAKNEGEYVDFEEVKDTRKNS